MHDNQNLKKQLYNERLHKRYECNQPIELYYRHQLVEKSSIINISQEGLLIELPNSTVKKGSIIEISLFSLYEKRQINFPGFVVHRQTNTIGVWLDDEDKVLKRYIGSMLQNITQF